MLAWNGQIANWVHGIDDKTLQLRRQIHSSQTFLLLTSQDSGDKSPVFELRITMFHLAFWTFSVHKL